MHANGHTRYISMSPTFLKCRVTLNFCQWCVEAVKAIPAVIQESCLGARQDAVPPTRWGAASSGVQDQTGTSHVVAR